MKTLSPVGKSKEIDTRGLKLPPKRKISVGKEVREKIDSVHEKKLGDIMSGVEAVDATKVNNGFLWFLAVVPFLYLLFLFAFVANPMDVRMSDVFAMWDFLCDHGWRSKEFTKLFWAAVCVIVGANTVFAEMDTHELKMRGKRAGKGFVAATAFFLVPVYLFFRGRPSLNEGCRKLAPYITWWSGWMLVDLLAKHYVMLVLDIVIAVVIAFIGFAFTNHTDTASMARGANDGIHKDDPESKNDINDALGI